MGQVLVLELMSPVIMMIINSQLSFRGSQGQGRKLLETLIGLNTKQVWDIYKKIDRGFHEQAKLFRFEKYSTFIKPTFSNRGQIFLDNQPAQRHADDLL